MTEKFNVRNLGLEGSIKQISELRDIDDHNIVLDFQQMNKVRSIGMVCFISAVEEMKSRGWRFYSISSADYWNNAEYHAISYAGGVGFFDALGLNQGNKMGQYPGSITYCPILRVTQKGLLNDSGIIQDGIENEAARLSEILTSDIPQAKRTMQYLIREIMRNTFEHTISDHVWIAAQRHSADGKIEVAIADNAQGIRQVISVNPDLADEISDDEDALRLSLKPGISGNAKFSKNSDFWSNSGYGLFVTSQVLNRLGSFVLVSGTKYLEFCNDDISVGDADFQGTAVRLEFDIPKISEVDASLISNIVKIGQKEALEDPNAVTVASKASQIVE